MAIAFKGKTSTGKPIDGTVQERELHFNLIDKTIYTSSDGTDVIEIGTPEQGGIAWVTAMVYAIGDIVTDSTKTYVCNSGHTSSAAFVTDIAKWDEMFTDIELTGSITEEVSVMPANVIDAANGTIQTKNITGNTTFTEALATGQSMTLILTNTLTSTGTITWPAMLWVGGSAPTLTDDDTLVFFDVGGQCYGSYSGANA